MKTTFTIVLFLITTSCLQIYAQTEKSLDETKLYIANIINEHGYEENSTTRKLKAEFDGDLLRIYSPSKILISSSKNLSIYDFKTVYRFKGPIRQPGDIAYLVIWTDYLPNEKSKKWSKKHLEIDIDNYAIGEQLMIALKHLNKLLIQKNLPAEKFED